MSSFRVFVLLFVGICHCANEATIDSGIVNKHVARKIDISSHVVKIDTAITLEESSSSYIFAIDHGYEDMISFVGAVSKVGDEDIEQKVEEVKVKNQNGKFYKIKLAGKNNKPVQQFSVNAVYVHRLSPYPSEIKQSEKQFVKFNGLLHYYSPYKSVKEETTVVITNTNALFYTQAKPVNKADANIVYGPFQNVQPFQKDPLEVHYENNSPFLTITEMKRSIEVSHWGNIAIEEAYKMYHSGALLKGPFSRYEYQRNQDGASSIKNFKTVLPAAARDVYYRDQIGNISTSHLREMVDSVELEIRPRFPLFGGWKTEYYIGYNVASYEYLYHRGNEFCLQMRFVDHIYDDQVIDRITLKVMLPEGVSNIRLETPFAVNRQPDEIFKTYLDTAGRVVVVATKANLVEGHIRNFRLFYHYNQLMMIREPFMVFVSFYILFLVVIVYVRLDFSITKDEASESRMRIAGLVEEVQAAQDKRSALYQAYDDATNRFKSSKDQARFTSDRKKIEQDHRTLTAQLAQLLIKLKVDSPESAEKVGELQSLDSKFREHGVQVALQLAEKLVGGRLQKQQYLEQEGKVNAKKEEILGKMEALLGSL